MRTPNAMHRLRSLLRILLPALALLAAPRGPAAAWEPGDPLTVIWRPLPNLPALVRPGDVLTVWARAPLEAGDWSAALLRGAVSRPLPHLRPDSAMMRGLWSVRFEVPQGMPEALYDLVLGCDSCARDTARHAVQVVPEFPDEFYFAQITDTHLPSHLASSSWGFDPADTSGCADLDAVIEDLNLIHPAFVLHTGDLVNEGELEDYLDMHEFALGQAILGRLADPVFLVAGNHDIGGWQATPPPAGTSRRDWWRWFGWPPLADPPDGYPSRTQDYSFDYGGLHVVGLEGYQNDGGYDGFLPEWYGAQSMTAAQMAWLAADLAAVPAGRTRLAFIHYDFGGTLPNGLAAPAGSQFAHPDALGLDGVIWGHWHDVPEGDRAARPFNLGLQSVIGNDSGGRAFRVFRVSGGVVTPGPMHHAGGAPASPVDSLAVAWSGPNDGTRASLGATVTNRFGEPWEHARLVFHLADRDSQLAAKGGAIASVERTAGRADVVVDCPLPASGTVTVSVAPTGPAPRVQARLEPPAPNPMRVSLAGTALHATLPRPGHAWLGVRDVSGRLVVTLLDAWVPAQEATVVWDGRGADGERVAPGLYFVALRAAGGETSARLVVLP